MADSKAASVSSSTVSTTKPKRPLSGYNLFYRYKRTKIIEATAPLAGHVISKQYETATINAILHAKTGLEGVPADHAIWSCPTDAINEFRASNIRQTMQDKLFPNENVRSRVHRKVIGMGFVEMGRVMRELWSNIDEFTKEVFSELAEVGRVRYRTLLAEYKMPNKTAGATIKSSKEAQIKDKVIRQVKRIYTPRSTKSSEDVHSSATSIASAPAYIDESPVVSKKPRVAGLVSPNDSRANICTAFTSCSSSAFGPASSSIVTVPTNFLPTSTRTSIPQNSVRQDYVISVPTFTACTQTPTNERQFTVAVPTNFMPSGSTSSMQERCMSSSDLSMYSAVSNMTSSACSSARSTPSLSDMMSSMRDYHDQEGLDDSNKINVKDLLSMSDLPPPPLYQQDTNMHGNDASSRFSESSQSFCNGPYMKRGVEMMDDKTSSPSLEDMISSMSDESPKLRTSSSFPSIEDMLSSMSDKHPPGMQENDDDEVSTQDMLNLISHLDEALPREPSMIFGKPIHDVDAL